jgi:hypothetical protein
MTATGRAVRPSRASSSRFRAQHGSNGIPVPGGGFRR